MNKIIDEKALREKAKYLLNTKSSLTEKIIIIIIITKHKFENINFVFLDSSVS